MKVKHIILVAIIAIMILNTLTGAIIEAYDISSCLLVDLSLCLSAGILYFLFVSDIADGFKISLAVIFSITGIIRAICMLIMKTEIKNNVLLLAFILIFLGEIMALFFTSYLSKKQ